MYGPSISVRTSALKRRTLTLFLAATFTLFAASMAYGAISTAPATTPPAMTDFRAASKRVAQLEQSHATAKVAAALKAATTAPDKALLGAADIFCRWDKFKNDPVKQQKLADKFLRDVQSYLKAAGNNVDPAWASIQAKFLLANVAGNAVNQIEFWSGTPALRRDLAPSADLARQLLERALKHYTNVLTKLNNATNFTHADEVLYNAANDGQSDASYFLAYADYYVGLSLPPGGQLRQKVFQSAIARITPFTTAQNNSVYYRAILLRGKAYLHNGQYNKALHDLAAAASSHAPVWIQYNGWYQQITALLRSGKYDLAQAKLKSFIAWTAGQPAANTTSAKMGAQLLALRIVMASAATLKEPASRAAAQAAAVKLVSKIIRKAPQYQSLIFFHLAEQLPAKVDPATLDPLQALALAWLDAQHPSTVNQRQALLVLNSLLARKDLDPILRAQATLNSAMVASQLGQVELAARRYVAFVRMAPHDPRAKYAMTMALSELFQLKDSSEVPPGTDALTAEAIRLDWHNFHDPQIRFPYALQLENTGHVNHATKLFESIPSSDQNYLDARFQLVRICAQQVTDLSVPTKHISLEQQQQAARKLLDTASAYLKLLDHPPATIGKEALARARGYRVKIMMLQAATALNPLRNPYRAGRILDKLFAMNKQLSPKTRGIILRYRIRQYQLAGENNKILPLIKSFAGQTSQNSADIIKGLIGQYDQESRSLRHTDPARSKRLAVSAASLLEALIQSMERQSKPGQQAKDDLYVYRQIRAGELIRAGQGQAAWNIYKQLESENPHDMTNFIGAARAAFAAGNLQASHSIYVRLIPHLEPGSEIYWQAYYYLIRSNVKANNSYPDETRAALEQLAVLYGKQIGGKIYHKQFEALLRQFNLKD